MKVWHTETRVKKHKAPEIKADKFNMRVSYNAPVTLTLSLFAVIVMVCDQYLSSGLISSLFTAEGKGTFNSQNIPGYIRLFTYIFGHKNWEHLWSNLMLVLLLGPNIEEKYGSGRLFFMVVVTAVLNGLINALFLQSELMGMSGIAFMLILLSSFGNVRRGDIPVTFLFVLTLYLWNEIKSILASSDISQLSHLLGSVCGSLFGFIEGGRRNSNAVPA